MLTGPEAARHLVGLVLEALAAREVVGEVTGVQWKLHLFVGKTQACRRPKIRYLCQEKNYQ